MGLLQRGKPEPVQMGQRLVIRSLDGYFGFREEDSGDYSPFVTVPIGTKFRMKGAAVEFVEMPKGPDGDIAKALKFNGGGSFLLSEIELLAPLEVTFIPGKSEQTGTESTDETENNQHSQDCAVGE